MYLSVMDSELRKAEDALTRYNMWSTDPAAIALRAKIDNLRREFRWLLSRGVSFNICLSVFLVCAFLSVPLYVFV